MAIGVATPANAAEVAAPSVLADAGLTACVRSHLEIPASQAVTAEMIGALTELTCDGLGSVHSLAGLENATSLVTLDLHDAISGAAGYATWPETQAATLLMLAPLEGLPALTNLDIASVSSMYRYDLAVLQTLPSLRALAMGSPTNADLEQVGNLKELESFAADYGDEISSIAGLAGMPHLMYLDLPRLYATDLSPLADLPALESVDLWAANASVVPDLGGLSNLAHVSLASSNVRSIAGLAGTALTSLNIRWTFVEDLAGLTDVSNLEELDLDYSSVQDLDELAGAHNLTALYASDANISSLAPLAGLEALAYVDVEYNYISDLTPLASVPTLEYLNVSSNRVTTIEPIATLPALAQIDLSTNRVIDISPLAQAPALTAYDAWDQTAATGDVPRCELAKIPVGTSIDGTVLYGEPVPRFSHSGPSAAAGTMFGDQSLIYGTLGGSVWLEAVDADNAFSVLRTGTASGTSENCAWPSSFTPSLSVSGSGDVGTSFTASVALTGAPTTLPSVTYHHREVPTAVSPEPSVFWDNGATIALDAGSDVGRKFEFAADVSLQGMQTYSLAATTGQVWGVFPDHAFALESAPTLATGASITTYSYIAAIPGHVPPDSVTETIQWYLDGKLWRTTVGGDFIGGFASSHAGRTLQAKVTFSAPNFRTRTFTTPAYTIQRNFTSDYWVGSITGSPNVGSTLTANPLHWDGLTVSCSYQWLRSGLTISGATGKTYKVTAADAGKTLSVKVTVSKPGYLTITDTMRVKINSVFTAPTPTVSGALVPGAKLTATAGTWSPAATLTYQWYRNGVKITGATKSSYTTRSTDVGAKYAVKVTGKKAGYTTVTKTSPTVTILKKFTATPTPTISGTPRVKSILTAKPGTWGPGTVTLSYQWYRNGVSIPGAVAKTYKPGAADAFASFKVKVTGKKLGYFTVARTSASVTASGLTYASCDALLADYPAGVAEAPSDGYPTETFVSAKLYALNGTLDLDLDGQICE